LTTTLSPVSGYLGLANDGTWSQPGNLVNPGDHQLFGFSTNYTGSLTIAMAPVGAGSTLVGSLVVRDSNLQVLATSTGQVGQDAQVTIPIAGQHFYRAYYIETTGAGGTTGRYALGLSFGTQETEPNDTLDTANDLTSVPHP